MTKHLVIFCNFAKETEEYMHKSFIYSIHINTLNNIGRSKVHTSVNWLPLGLVRDKIPEPYLGRIVAQCEQMSGGLTIDILVLRK
jgi:hypothetical protein